MTKHWDDWVAPSHAHSFTIAGAPSVDFVKDMQAALVGNIEQGLTIADFRKTFDAIVKKYGWSYKGERGWRTRVIYQTNMRSARMAAKWRTIQDNKDIAPFLEYLSVLDGRTTKNCKAWDNLILSVDDEFWSTLYPPNHWGCRATVRQLSAASLKREGKAVDSSPNVSTRDVLNPSTGEVYHNVPHGISPGWDYNVGQAWIAPDVSLGKKLARLPRELAGSAYQNQVSDGFLKSVDKSWRAFRSNVKSTHATNAIQFVGLGNHKVQAALTDKAETIMAKTAEINAKRAASPVNNLPQLKHPDLNPESLAMVAPDFKVDHLEGIHKAGSSSQWNAEWIDSLPSLLHDYQAVLYDTDAQALVYVTKAHKDGRYATAYVNINQSKKKMLVSNWVKSLNTKPLQTLNEPRFIILDGSLSIK
ncbi:phage head morphogenesis protein [Ephemeroptericola cinctiostellae]|uniref:phage head morphogenesis protein n=1 Tax=Ephemeroptericola cinctiostellae TaxID=2268024 RepID=UPI001CEF7014|nr:phage minor head protein [Ephemeroptericola cinctiostellae]